MCGYLAQRGNLSILLILHSTFVLVILDCDSLKVNSFILLSVNTNTILFYSFIIVTLLFIFACLLLLSHIYLSSHIVILVLYKFVEANWISASTLQLHRVVCLSSRIHADKAYVFRVVLHIHLALRFHHTTPLNSSSH